MKTLHTLVSKVKTAAVLGISLLPSVGSAQPFSSGYRFQDTSGAGGAPAAPRTLAELIYFIIDYINLIIPLILSLAILTFIWGVYKKFFKPEADPKEAGNFLLYSVLGFFVILAFWGLVNILLNTFGLDTTFKGMPCIINC
jgi:hypothetical protein